MAMITSIQRSGTTSLFSYPANYPGWGTGKHACPGCLGIRGDCTAAIRSTRLLVNFTLSDGRAGVVDVSTSATNLQIQAAIQAWAIGNPILAPDPLVGQAIST